MPPPVVVAAAALFWAAAVFAQGSPPPIAEEPHHARRLYTAHLRLFEVTLPPRGMTMDHVRDRDLALVSISGAADPPGSIRVTPYTGAPAVVRVENTADTPYRAFAVENLRERGWSTPRLIAAPGTTLVEQSRAFAVYDVRLTTAAERTSHTHEMPTVVILLAGTVEVQGGGGESTFRLNAPGRWFPSMWDQPHTLSLVGAADARLIEIEAR